jgi:uncharacterized protein
MGSTNGNTIHASEEIDIDTVFQYREYRGKNYDRILSGFLTELERPEATFEDLLSLYLKTFPTENAYSEHLHVTGRRRVLFFLNTQVERNAKTPGAANYSVADFARFVDQPHILERCSSKERSKLEAKFLAARLLQEIGSSEQAGSMLQDVAHEGAKADDNSLDKVIGLLALNCYAVILQNRGSLDEARTILENLKSTTFTFSTGSANADITELFRYHQHVLYKHRGTLLRRIVLSQTKHTSKDLKPCLDELNQAKAFYDTHHVRFSLGYIKYLQNDIDGAQKEFEQCLKRLGKRDSEYYLVHIKRLLAEMKRGSIANRSLLIDKFKLYKQALNKTPNFKINVNRAVRILLERLFAGGVPTEWDISKYVTNREDLVCIKHDIETILEYFGNLPNLRTPLTDFAKSVRLQLTRVEAQLVKLDETLRFVPQVDNKTTALAVCVDIRESTLMDQASFETALTGLRESVASLLAPYFDAVQYTGDGYLLVRSLKKLENASETRRLFTTVLNQARQLLASNAGISLGIGVSIEDVTYFRTTASVATIEFFMGPAAVYATRMCDHAKPCGMVIYKNDAFAQHVGKLEELSLPFTFHEVTFADKNETTYAAFASAETSQNRCLVRASDPREKRIFLQYGPACRQNCEYCINKTLHQLPRVSGDPTPDTTLESPSERQERIRTETDALTSKIRREIEEIASKIRIDEHLLSLGHLNEPLSADNYENTLAVLRTLLGSTQCTIQLATKANGDTVKRLFTDLEALGSMRRRIHVLLSLSTVEYAHELEHRAPSTIEATLDSLQEIALGSSSDDPNSKDTERFHIIPYVKPFLPGITDLDPRLKTAINGYSRVIVGYPYLSKPLLDRMTKFCLAQRDKRREDSAWAERWGQNIDRHYASYQQAQTETISHPGHVNGFATTKDLHDSFKAFVGALTNAHVSVSSPCASACIDRRTSYTLVGESANATLFCTGNRDNGTRCGNEHCVFNARFPKENHERIAIEVIRNKSSATVDSSHALDHFIRVKNIAFEILEGEPSLSDYKNNPDFRLKTLLSCLLHDLGDKKTQSRSAHNEKDRRSDEVIATIGRMRILGANVSKAIERSVINVILSASFDDFIHRAAKGRGELSTEDEKLCQLLEDADKIDAIGAIGIARCFSFPKNKGIFNIAETPRTFHGLKELKGYAASVTHFYEKLLSLHHLLNYEMSRSISLSTQQWTHLFVNRFLNEYQRSFGPKSEERVRLEALQNLAREIATDVSGTRMRDEHRIHVDLRSVDAIKQ